MDSEAILVIPHTTQKLKLSGFKKVANTIVHNQVGQPLNFQTFE